MNPWDMIAWLLFWLVMMLIIVFGICMVISQYFSEMAKYDKAVMKFGDDLRYGKMADCE